MKRSSIFLSVAVLSMAFAYGQKASDVLGVNVSHPDIQQRPSNTQSGGDQSGSNSSGDSGAQISRYNRNVKQIQECFKLSYKGDAARQKQRWADAAKLYNQAATNLPTNFNGGVGSDQQESRVARDKAHFWARHAYCIYRMGQLESAVSEFQWVVQNSMYAETADLENARTSITVIQEQLYEAAMEKKKQEALKLHNSDFQPHPRSSSPSSEPPLPPGN